MVHPSKELSISVVIPYFQRERGILAKALQSIESQSAFDSIDKVVVVDDGSPIPASEELSALSKNGARKVNIITQKNGGVSKARNRGLDELSGQAEYIAFLDSDDVWEKMHIEKMIAAFTLGADFYFSNFYQLDQKTGAFERAERLIIADHKNISEDLYFFQTDMTKQILTGNLIGTPTVGYKFSKHYNCRFRDNLKYAGEDYLFWLDIAKTQPVIVFSTSPNVRCGAGVNIYSGAKWGTQQLQLRIKDQILFRKLVKKSYSLTDETEIRMDTVLWHDRRTLLQNTLSMVKRGRLYGLPILICTVTRDPKTLLSAFYNP